MKSLIPRGHVQTVVRRFQKRLDRMKSNAHTA